MIGIYSFVLGPLEENTFIIYDETLECLIIDPGCSNAQEEKEIEDFISSKKLRPVRLINTHTHLDHILGNSFIAKQYNLIPEYHALEDLVIRNAPAFAENFEIPYVPSPLAEKYLNEKDTIQFGNSELKILFTPGHSPGHLSFYNEEAKVLIGGDVLFRGSIGRTDIPFGDYELLIKSIKKELLTLPEDTLVYSGHGISTEIGYELTHNPYLI
jgi:hydroxyacylglutathione hydrolase